MLNLQPCQNATTALKMTGFGQPSPNLENFPAVRISPIDERQKLGKSFGPMTQESNFTPSMFLKSVEKPSGNTGYN